MSVRVQHLAGVALALTLTVFATGHAAASDEYRLGPQDKLRIKVHEWRASLGEVHEWTALNGEFTVSAAGTISLPLIGEVPAASSRTDELAKTISERLQARVGLVQKPDASVEVLQFRPFYIVGKVEKPGEYAYRPGLNVLQAISVAGGMYRPADPGLLRLERETITIEGNLDTFAREIDRLSARRARLESELKDESAVQFPAELTGKKGDPAVDKLLNDERLIFEARREDLRMRVEALRQLKSLLESEVEALRSRIDTKEKQLKLIRRELQDVVSLVGKGLAVAPRQFSLERVEADYEAGRLELDTAMLRARAEISRTERNIIELNNQYHNDILVELRQTQAKLEEATQGVNTNRDLLSEADRFGTLAETRTRELEPIYSLVRADGETIVSETTPVQPGDILKVQLPARRPQASMRPAHSAAPIVAELPINGVAASK